MAARRSLFLHEEILLLALRDKKGTVAAGSTYQYAIGGAVLAELLLRKRVTVETSRKKKYAVLADPTPVGDPLLDECIAKLEGSKRRAQLQTWVSRFAGVKNLKHLVAKQLCRQGILRADEDKVMLIFTRRVYPELDPAPERKLVDRLRRAVFTDATDLDPRTVVLVSMADAGGLLRLTFDKKKLKGRKKRIEQIGRGDATGKATRDAIAAMQAAVMVAAIMPAMIATTTMHH